MFIGAPIRAAPKCGNAYACKPDLIIALPNICAVVIAPCPALAKIIISFIIYTPVLSRRLYFLLNSKIIKSLLLSHHFKRNKKYTVIQS
ncbi:MAG: hypothetical protein RMJ13_00835 [Elusimicrobiota bacterium]|nr:hypothetical protein [Elusimicrobiota bacterium]